MALNQMVNSSAEEITAAAVEYAIRLTGSKIGYLATMNEDETVLTMQYWSKTAHADCQVFDKPFLYPIEKTGLWGEAVRQRQPIITNDYARPQPVQTRTPRRTSASCATYEHPCIQRQ